MEDFFIRPPDIAAVVLEQTSALIFGVPGLQAVPTDSFVRSSLPSL